MKPYRRWLTWNAKFQLSYQPPSLALLCLPLPISCLLCLPCSGSFTVQSWPGVFKMPFLPSLATGKHPLGCRRCCDGSQVTGMEHSSRAEFHTLILHPRSLLRPPWLLECLFFFFFMMFSQWASKTSRSILGCLGKLWNLFSGLHVLMWFVSSFYSRDFQTSLIREALSFQ